MEIVKLNIPKPPESTAAVILTRQEVRIIRKALGGVLDGVPSVELADVDATVKDASELFLSMRQLERDLT